MKNLIKIAFAAILLIAASTSCDDEVSTIGSSLIQDQVEIVIDSSFVITGEPIVSGSVQSRTVLQLLGDIDAKNYGSFRSDIVTQLMPTQAIETEGVTVDSVKLIMRVPLGAYVGDSLMPMGVEVFRLNKQLPVPIYSNFDVKDYYDASTPLAKAMYALTAQGNGEAKTSYRYINVNLGKSFGDELIERYKSNPSTFSSPKSFAEWFPGFYIRSSFGSGRVVQIDSTVVTMYYRQQLPIEGTDRDTIYLRSSSYLAVTPEIITNNNMNLALAPELEKMAQDKKPILVAPTGYDVKISIPTDRMLEQYRTKGGMLSVLNGLRLRIPVEDIANDYGLTPPPYILMVKATEKDNFFMRSQLPNQKTSFYASYDSYNRCYEFSDMREYLLEMLDKDEVTADDMDFIICPVTIGFESNSTSSSYYYYYYYSMPTQTMTVASVVPYVNRPSMALLNLEKAKLILTYSVQNINF